MTSGRYLEGLLFVAIALVPIGVAARTWRAHLLPEWTGAPAHLAEIVMGLAAVVCVCELLGSIDLFHTAAIVPTLGCVGIAAWFVCPRSSVVVIRTDDESEEPTKVQPSSPPQGATLGAVAAVAVVAADWGTRTVDAFHHGMTTVDTLWYHMPFAARFVQQGTVTPLHYFDSGAVTAFFPASSELVQALGIIFMGGDLVAPLINLGWGAMALLAGWCIGRPFGVAPVTLTGVALLMATPGLVATQPGGAYDDIVGIALLLSCAALLVTGFSVGRSTRLASQGIAALAAGLALSTKFTFVVPVAALTIGIWVLAPRGRRLREGGVWLLLVAITGGFWYLRNLIAVGNPLPSLHVKLGPLALPSPVQGTPSSTVAHFLLNVSAWRKYFLPGLRLSFGPAWWAIFAFAAAGLILGIAAAPSRMPRMIAWVGLVTAAAFLVTPQYLTILGVPVFFVDNVRYVDPAIVLGVVLLPLAPVLRAERRMWVVLGGYLGILAATQLDHTIWPINVFTQRFANPIYGVDSLVGLLFGVVVLGIGVSLFHLRRSRTKWTPPAVAVVVLIIGVLASGLALQQFYLRNRYTNSNPIAVFARVQSINHARIAVAGVYTQAQYELYGRDLTNYVEYVGQSEPHGGYLPASSCSQWRKLLNSGRYDYVLTSTSLVPQRRDVFKPAYSYSTWTATDPMSVLIQREIFTIPVIAGPYGETEYVGFSLFRLRGPLDPATCSSSKLRSVVPTEA